MYKIEFVNTVTGAEGCLPGEYSRAKGMRLVGLLNRRLSGVIFWHIHNSVLAEYERRKKYGWESNPFSPSRRPGIDYRIEPTVRLAQRSLLK